MESNFSVEAQKKFWSAMAEAWEKWDHLLLGPRQGLHSRMIQLGEVDKTSKVIDVAAGTGEPGLTAAAIATEGQVFGCDISQEMLDVALKKANAKKYGNYTTCLLTENKLPFSDHFFDAGLCAFGLEFNQNFNSLFEEMHRVLKPDGRFVVCIWGPISSNPYQYFMGNCLKAIRPQSEIPKTMSRFESYEIIESAYIRHNFINIKHEVFKGYFVFAGFEEFWLYSIDVFSPLTLLFDSLSEVERRELKIRLFDACKEFIQQESSLSIPFEVEVFFGENRACVEFPE